MTLNPALRDSVGARVQPTSAISNAHTADRNWHDRGMGTARNHLLVDMHPFNTQDTLEPRASRAVAHPVAKTRATKAKSALSPVSATARILMRKCEGGDLNPYGVTR